MESLVYERKERRFIGGYKEEVLTTWVRLRLRIALPVRSGEQRLRYAGDELRTVVDSCAYRDSLWSREIDGGYTTVVRSLAEYSPVENAACVLMATFQ